MTSTNEADYRICIEAYSGRTRFVLTSGTLELCKQNFGEASFNPLIRAAIAAGAMLGMNSPHIKDVDAEELIVQVKYIEGRLFSLDCARIRNFYSYIYGVCGVRIEDEVLKHQAFLQQQAQSKKSLNERLVDESARTSKVCGELLYTLKDGVSPKSTELVEATKHFNAAFALIQEALKAADAT